MQWWARKRPGHEKLKRLRRPVTMEAISDSPNFHDRDRVGKMSVAYEDQQMDAVLTELRQIG